jgi:hypothetical protein
MRWGIYMENSRKIRVILVRFVILTQIEVLSREASSLVTKSHSCLHGIEEWGRKEQGLLHKRQLMPYCF